MTGKNKRKHNELSPLKTLLRKAKSWNRKKKNQIDDIIDLFQPKTRMKKVKLTKDFKKNRGFYFLPRKVIIEALEMRETYLKPFTCNKEVGNHHLPFKTLNFQCFNNTYILPSLLTLRRLRTYFSRI